MRRFGVVVVVLAVAGAALFTSMIAVAETEYAVVTRFGRPVRILDHAGLSWKLPWPVEDVTRIDRRMQVFDPVRDSTTADERITADKKQVLVSSFCVWRVKDPLRFLVSVRDVERAEARLDDLIQSEIGAAMQLNELTAFLPSSGGAGRTNASQTETQLGPFMDEITRAVAASAERSFGIEILSVRVKRLGFPETNKNSVYQRMGEERRRISAEIRETGRKEAALITQEAEREKSKIIAEARQEAAAIEGNAEAEVIRIYDEAYREAPELFELLRELEVLEGALGPDDWIYLGRNSNLESLLSILPRVNDRAEGADGSDAGSREDDDR